MRTAWNSSGTRTERRQLGSGTICYPLDSGDPDRRLVPSKPSLAS